MNPFDPACSGVAVVVGAKLKTSSVVAISSTDSGCGLPHRPKLRRPLPRLIAASPCDGRASLERAAEHRANLHMRTDPRAMLGARAGQVQPEGYGRFGSMTFCQRSQHGTETVAPAQRNGRGQTPQ
jgi:hypothetical protein